MDAVLPVAVRAGVAERVAPRDPVDRLPLGPVANLRGERGVVGGPLDGDRVGGVAHEGEPPVARGGRRSQHRRVLAEHRPKRHRPGDRVAAGAGRTRRRRRVRRRAGGEGGPRGVGRGDATGARR